MDSADTRGEKIQDPTHTVKKKVGMTTTEGIKKLSYNKTLKLPSAEEKAPVLSTDAPWPKQGASREQLPLSHLGGQPAAGSPKPRNWYAVEHVIKLCSS